MPTCARPRMHIPILTEEGGPVIGDNFLPVAKEALDSALEHLMF